MARLLVVDDEEKIRLIIRKYAEMEGHQVTEAKDGIEAVSICALEDFDVIILDVMMPGMDGFAVCKQVRRYKKIPVIMLSARGEEYDRIKGFELGVDDYVVKPFSPKELIARVNAIINRTNKDENKEKIEKEKIIIDTLQIDRLGRTVTIDGKKIEMTPKEYDLLVYLIINKNIALSRENILSKVWGYDFFGEDRTVDTHIKMLRNNLGKYRDKIVTVRGMGYKFEDED